MPGMSMRYLALEAAAHFGCGDSFFQLPQGRRAELMAHLVIKAQRDEYVTEKLKARDKTRTSGSHDKPGYDPAEMQRRRWLNFSE